MIYRLLRKRRGWPLPIVTTVAALHRTYWPRRPLDSVMYEHYSLCTLKPA